MFLLPAKNFPTNKMCVSVCRSVGRSVAVFFIWVCRCSVLKRWARAHFRPIPPVYYCTVHLYSNTQPQPTWFLGFESDYRVLQNPKVGLKIFWRNAWFKINPIIGLAIRLIWSSLEIIGVRRGARLTSICRAQFRMKTQRCFLMMLRDSGRM